MRRALRTKLRRPASSKSCSTRTPSRASPSPRSRRRFRRSGRSQRPLASSWIGRPSISFAVVRNARKKARLADSMWRSWSRTTRHSRTVSTMLSAYFRASSRSCSLRFAASMSNAVRTVPSMRLSCVRYGRAVSWYQRPAWSCTGRSTAARRSRTSAIIGASSAARSCGSTSPIGRPTSPAPRRKSLAAAGVNRRMRESRPRMTIGISTLLSTLVRSSLSRVLSALRTCMSSLTLRSSSLVACSSSFAIWSSSFVERSSSLLETISSLAALSSSLLASSCSMTDWR